MLYEYRASRRVKQKAWVSNGFAIGAVGQLARLCATLTHGLTAIGAIIWMLQNNPAPHVVTDQSRTAPRLSHLTCCVWLEISKGTSENIGQNQRNLYLKQANPSTPLHILQSWPDESWTKNSENEMLMKYCGTTKLKLNENFNESCYHLSALHGWNPIISSRGESKTKTSSTSRNSFLLFKIL